MNTSLWRTLWKTAGQWASGLSVIAAKRLTKQTAITAAQGAFAGEGENTGKTLVRSPPDTGSQALNAVQTDDVDRFDVDNDDCREATEWLSPVKRFWGWTGKKWGAGHDQRTLQRCQHPVCMGRLQSA